MILAYLSVGMCAVNEAPIFLFKDDPNNCGTYAEVWANDENIATSD
jgi:hypothetical protein